VRMRRTKLNKLVPKRLKSGSIGTDILIEGSAVPRITNETSRSIGKKYSGAPASTLSSATLQAQNCPHFDGLFITAS